MNAWEEAYGLLAEIFIDRERQIREGQANAPGKFTLAVPLLMLSVTTYMSTAPCFIIHKSDWIGGWEGFRDFIVDKKVNESDEIASFYLRPADGGKILDYTPGAYIALRAEMPEMTTHRNYTLSSMPGMTWHTHTLRRTHTHHYREPWPTVGNDMYRITVKREGPMAPGCPPGLVSGWLHDSVNEGDILKIGVPCGDFLLKTDGNRPMWVMALFWPFKTEMH